MLKFKGKIINLSKNSKGVIIPKLYFDNEQIKQGKVEIVVRNITEKKGLEPDSDENGQSGIPSREWTNFIFSGPKQKAYA